MIHGLPFAPTSWYNWLPLGSVTLVPYSDFCPSTRYRGSKPRPPLGGLDFMFSIAVWRVPLLGLDLISERIFTPVSSPPRCFHSFHTSRSHGTQSWPQCMTMRAPVSCACASYFSIIIRKNVDSPD